jgi:hypothetical protein
MKQARALAMALFDTYSEMQDEDQAEALANLKIVDPAVHDALVQMLVTDALSHTLDVPPWLGPATPALSAEDDMHDEGVAPSDRERR